MYKRVLLKLSGESLSDNQQSIDGSKLEFFANEIKEVYQSGVQIAIVIGGGNIFRGLKNVSKGFGRIQGDYMGMMATVINSLALQSALESIDISSVVLTATKIEGVGEKMSSRKAIQQLEEKKVVIISGGTGNPFFTTDSASALRALEIKADVLLKGTRVDGVYSADPEKNPNAQKYEKISYDEAYQKKLKIMDLTAFTLCKENSLPLIIFNMNTKGNVLKAVKGEKLGTLIQA